MERVAGEEAVEETVVERSAKGETRMAMDGRSVFGLDLIIAGDQNLQLLSNAWTLSSELS